VLCNPICRLHCRTDSGKRPDAVFRSLPHSAKPSGLATVAKVSTPVSRSRTLVILTTFSHRATVWVAYGRIGRGGGVENTHLKTNSPSAYPSTCTQTSALSKHGALLSRDRLRPMVCWTCRAGSAAAFPANHGSAPLRCLDSTQRVTAAARPQLGPWARQSLPCQVPPLLMRRRDRAAL